VNEPSPSEPAFLDRYHHYAELYRPFTTMLTTTGTHRAICPDLLSTRNIGEADDWRGRAIHGFFRVLRVVTGL